MPVQTVSPAVQPSRGNQISILDTPYPAPPTKPIFISYASEDWKVAEMIAGELERLGYETWLDHHRLRGGELWEDVVEDRLAGASRVVALVSPTSVAKGGYVEREWRQAERIASSRDGDQPFLIPVTFKSGNLDHGAGFRWCTEPIRLNGRWPSGIADLCSSLPMPGPVPGLEVLLLGTCWSARTLVDNWLEAWVFELCAFGEVAYSNWLQRFEWMHRGDHQKRRKQGEPWRVDGRWTIESQSLRIVLPPYEMVIKAKLNQSKLEGVVTWRSGTTQDITLFHDPGVVVGDMMERIRWLSDVERQGTLEDYSTIDLLDLLSP